MNLGVLVQAVEQAVMVPASALFPIGLRSGIFVVEDGHSQPKKGSAEARSGVSSSN